MTPLDGFFVLCALYAVARLIMAWSRRDLERSLERYDFSLWESELTRPFDQDRGVDA